MALEQVLMRWTQNCTFSQPIVFCIPSKATESWLVPLLFADDQTRLHHLECRKDIYPWFSTKAAGKLMNADGSKKRRTRYQSLKPTITQSWQIIKEHCLQAQKFEIAIKAALENASP